VAVKLGTECECGVDLVLTAEVWLQDVQDVNTVYQYKVGPGAVCVLSKVVPWHLATHLPTSQLP